MPAAGQRFMSVAERMASYRVDGVPVHQFGGNDHRGYSEMGQENTNIMTMCVHGLVRSMIKFWGNNVMPGTRLYLLIKRMPRNEIMEFSLDASSVTPTKVMIQPGVSLVNNPFQVIPWASTVDHEPPTSVREYRDDNGRKRTGGYIYIGKVDDPNEWNNPSRHGSVATNSKAAFDQGQFDVFLNIGALEV
jgi:hypothetical protein